MKITDIETFAVDGGIGAWLFCAVRTDEGITGWGEFGMGSYPKTLLGLIEDMKPLVIGQDPEAVEKIYFDLYRTLRHASGGIASMGIAGIELACWDIKGKMHGVPVYRLAGGPFREKQRVYWSHLASIRAARPDVAPDKPIKDWDAVADAAREAADKGYTAFKTNIIFPGTPSKAIFQLLGAEGGHDQLAERDLVRHAVKQISTMREAVGPDVEILLDINFNFKTEGAIRLAQALEPYDLFWLEIDNEDPEALAQLKASTRTPICSGEQLLTMREYQPYFSLHAMDTVKVDVQWQGFGPSKKVADLAETYEMNIAPHNPASHLATFQSVNLTAAVSNVRIMESDPDAMPWRDDLFTVVPEVIDSYMTVPTVPGWGTEPIEAQLKKHALDR